MMVAVRGSPRSVNADEFRPTVASPPRSAALRASPEPVPITEGHARRRDERLPWVAPGPPRAAALLHSLARNHALIDGNKRLGLSAVIAFSGLNGRRLTLTNDQAYDLVMKAAAGELDQVEEIAAIVQAATVARL